MTNEWKHGFPPGKMTPQNKEEMLARYEIHFTPLCVWHRERPEWKEKKQ